MLLSILMFILASVAIILALKLAKAVCVVFNKLTAFKSLFSLEL